ncbi:MAG TPA: hypothetical protein VJ818_07315 [Actinomycetota bacterium]|nr:hypothetical protein [Actinomycetota bacterium]
MSEHHAQDPMKGHPHAGPSPRRRWWQLRTRSDSADHVVRTADAYPGVFSYISGHRDAPITPLQRFLWWLAGVVIIFTGILLIIFWMR